jgi:hypothetical protein
MLGWIHEPSPWCSDGRITLRQTSNSPIKLNSIQLILEILVLFDHRHFYFLLGGPLIIAANGHYKRLFNILRSNLIEIDYLALHDAASSIPN